MLLFFGTRQIVRDDDRPGGGIQRCARCGQVVPFKARTARTFIHVFWIPIIPIGQRTPIWECTNCHARYTA